METPKKIGKYEVMNQIATGGFGVIYKGWDPFIKRPVAIKTCVTPDSEARERFHREAEFVGNLVHRNITLVFDFGTEGEIPYIVQEYLTGYDLDQLFKAGVLDGEIAVASILLQVCEGLDFAHHRGIIHRDIKPSNIRVLEDGTVKIMDFGIAKSLESGPKLTQTGIALGTAGYLAPEQIKGEAVDPRTDIFSLGVVGYELVTGVRPFEGSSLSNVLYRILNEVPPPARTVAPGCSAAMDEILQRCMAKEPDHRFQTANELAEALRGIPVPAEATTLKENTTSILRGLVCQLNRDEAPVGGDSTARDIPQLRPEPTPQEAVLHHPPEIEEGDERRSSPVLMTFLIMLMLVVGAGVAVYLSEDVQELVFPGGVPWVATATPTPSPSPTPIPTPTATPAPPPATATPSAAPRSTVSPKPVGPVSLRLVVDPPAEVTVDGTPFGQGRVPGGRITLAPGLHTFTLTIPDFPPKNITRRVTADTTTISLTIDVGLLTLVLDDSAPAGGVAFLDGNRLGPVPLVLHKVEAGPHDLVVRWEGAKPLRKKITVPRIPNPPLVEVVAPPP